jgi:TonB-linked SusC/RagA family outer membrane protein
MSRSRWLTPLLVCSGLCVFTWSPVAAQQGAVVGRVTDVLTGQVVSQALVTVVGTNQGALTNAEGLYIIRAVTAGAVTLRVTALGYADQAVDFMVLASQNNQADVSLVPVPLGLSGVVVTVTGEQRRVEVGNAIARVDAAALVQTRAVSNIADLLVARAPGVLVVPGVQTGAGVRVRIRGLSSLSLTRNPIYIVDGVRVEGTTGSSSVSVGGTTPSRIGDLNPEEIESIEVVRGPSAATLYGTDAANGVIVITTKRGIAGRPQWTYYTEQTAVTDRNNYPTAYRGWRTGPTSGTTSTPSNTVQCFLSQVAAGTCMQDSVTAYNLHKDKESTPYGTGYRFQHGLQVRGGTETIRYFLHGEWESEDGVTKVPEFEKRYMAARGLSLTKDQQNPGGLVKGTARVNLSAALSDNLDVSVNTGYISQDLTLPRSDDSGTAGIAANVYGGPGFKYNVNTAGDTLYGWREFTPRRIYQTETKQEIERFINSVGANWRPLSWLAFRGNAGLDYINRVDSQICRFGDCALTNDRLGFKTNNRTNFYTYTLDVNGSATRRINTDLESQTAVGVQFYRSIFDANYASGSQLPPGAVTVTSAAVKSASESRDESRTLGTYLEQRFSFRDRLFLTGAVRSDRNSAFGADFKTVFYPKFSASWVISEEDFFPALDWVSQLRVRTAYGASGVQPGTIAAVQYYSTTQVLGEGGEASGVIFSTLGNTKMKPERSTELEVGFDATLFSNRFAAEVTYYTKSSTDALISRILPPSLGTGATARLENLGEVSNKGWEVLLDARLLQTSLFEWSATFNGAVNENELVSLGGLPDIVVSSTLQHREGYPLWGWWSRRLLSYEDKDGNGIITYNADPARSEIVVSDTAQYSGRSLPKYQAVFTNGLSFWSGQLRLDAMLDYQGGFMMYNNTERIRCASRFNCSGLINPNSSLFEQARTVLVREHPSRSVAGFLEKGDFVRFRELSLTFSPPSGFAGGIFRGRTVSATLAARNLGILWTEYTGVDPEALGGNTDGGSEFQAFGPPTYFSFRLSVGF